MRRIHVAAALVALSAPVTVAAAKNPAVAPPAALKKLTDCRSIADVSERLTCYDREVAALNAAQARKELVIVERDELRKTRRTLFGLSLPNLSVFGDDSPGEEGISRVESTIKAVSQTAYGKWILQLQDGAQWVQVDSRSLSTLPRPGQPIVIRKAAVGSYLANVNKQTAIRVRRAR